MKRLALVTLLALMSFSALAGELTWGNPTASQVLAAATNKYYQINEFVIRTNTVNPYLEIGQIGSTFNAMLIPQSLTLNNYVTYKLEKPVVAKTRGALINLNVRDSAGALFPQGAFVLGTSYFEYEKKMM